MARCTAPVRGHRTESGRANCPACGGRYGRYGGYNSYSSYGSYSSPSYPSSASARSSSSSSAKASLVASGFVCGVHGRASAGTHADPYRHRDSNFPV